MSLKSPGTLLKESYGFYMQHAKLLVSVAIVPALISGAALVIASLTTTAEPAGTPLGMIGALLAAVLGILTTIALVQTIASGTESISLSDAYKRAIPLFFSYFWAAILSGLAVLLGLVLFIIPGIIVGVWLCFVHLAVILEGKRGTAALSQSKAYVSGMWFYIFIRLLVIGAVMFAVIIAVSLLLSVFLGSGVVFTAASDLASTAMSPFGLVYVYLLYKDVQKAKAHPSGEPVAVLS